MLVGILDSVEADACKKMSRALRSDPDESWREHARAISEEKVQLIEATSTLFYQKLVVLARNAVSYSI